MNNTLKAKIVSPAENGRNYGGDKEIMSCYSVVVLHKGEIVEPVTLRTYTGRSRSASTVYASIWVHGNGTHCAGTGSAGGGGYCKESAASAEAIGKAGIELYGTPYTKVGEAPDFSKRAHIGGTGMQSVEKALLAITKALGYRGKAHIVRH